MNGKHHEDLLNFLFAIAMGYLIYTKAYWVHIIYFGALWLIGTYLWTPDRDTHSRSTKRAGFSGKLVDKSFKHHGILHSFWLWAILGLAGFYYIGWFILGLIIPQIVHIVSDAVSTTWKRQKVGIIVGNVVMLVMVVIIYTVVIR